MTSLDEAERKRALRRGAEDLRRAPADASTSPRRASSSARRRASTNVDAGAAAAAAAVVARHDRRAPLMAAYLARRLAFAVLLVFAVSSASLVLTRLAPGDFADRTARADRRIAKRPSARARATASNRSIGAQYVDWLCEGGALRLRPLAGLRPAGAGARSPSARPTRAILALTALRARHARRPAARHRHRPRAAACSRGAVRAASVLLLSMPPLLTSLFLVFVAARTGWLPIGGMRSADAVRRASPISLHHMVVPVLALALPLSAMFERLQSQAMGEAIGQPFVLATLARGVPPAAHRLARRAQGGAAPDRVGLRPGRRHAAQRIVRRRDHHDVAGPRPADARRAARARRLSGRRLRGRRLGVSRRRHAPVGRRAGARRSARQRNERPARLRGRRPDARRGSRWPRSSRRAIAPHDPTTRFAGLLNAPPTAFTLRDERGAVAAPFIYPWTRVSQLEQRYEEDRSRPVPLAWFADGRLVRSTDDARAPLLLLGADSYGRDVFSRLLFGARTLARPGARRGARRDAPRRAARRASPATPAARSTMC